MGQKLGIFPLFIVHRASQRTYVYSILRRTSTDPGQLARTWGEIPEGPQFLFAENPVIRCLGEKDVFPEAIDQDLETASNDSHS